MYDRATRSLWPQVLGQAVVGPLTGTQLERRPVLIVSWDQFKGGFPDGSVLSRDTGFTRRYGDNPYPGYATEGPLSGDSLQPMDGHDSFWFDWAAFHPNTSVWAPSSAP